MDQIPFQVIVKQAGGFGFNIPANAPIIANPTRVVAETFSAKIITDVSVTYALKPWVGITLGVNNLFDVYPDSLKNYENTIQGSRIYCAEASPFGFNGGYYYLNLAFTW